MELFRTIRESHRETQMVQTRGGGVGVGSEEVQVGGEEGKRGGVGEEERGPGLGRGLC